MRSLVDRYYAGYWPTICSIFIDVRKSIWGRQVKLLKVQLCSNCEIPEGNCFKIIAILFGIIPYHCRTKEMSLNASKYLAVASEAMKRVDRARSMKLAQRAIHLNPLCQEAWDVLVSCKS